MLKSARIGAAAILPAAIVFGVYSDDPGGYDGLWVVNLVPIALVAIVAVCCLDGPRGVVPAAVCCGVIVAVAAQVERDDRPLPHCGGFMNIATCKNDALPQAGIGAAMVVFVGGGAVALIASPFKTRSPSS